ncbi:MAG: hypothetical protein ACJAQT_004299 [Akkermansiaceae bacterium]
MELTELRTLATTDASPNKAEPNWRKSDEEAVSCPDIGMNVLPEFGEVSNREQQDLY